MHSCSDILSWSGARACASLSVSHQSFLRLDERPVDAVHLVVQAAGVAQVVAGAVPAPQRRGHGAAVDALPSLGGHVVDQV